MRWLIVSFGLILTFCTCHQRKETVFSFYHWKSKAEYTNIIGSALETTKTKKIYLHYFDVDGGRENDDAQKDLFPKYTLLKVSPEFLSFEIIPVVYIVNSTLDGADIYTLSSHIHALVNQISDWRFHRLPKTIQLDCDWTSSTREQYFSLVKRMQEYYEVNVTIRLHQIKYQKETGIPPVERGTLMLYNIGHLDSTSENSILESSIVSEYINASTSYPIALDVALPIFSQTVIRSKEKQIRIIPGADPYPLEKDQHHFQRLNDHLFTVLQDTLYKGFYLSPGYTLKLEKTTEREIVNSYHLLKEE
jgi:hypothetical protein